MSNEREKRRALQGAIVGMIALGGAIGILVANHIGDYSAPARVTAAAPGTIVVHPHG